MDVLEYWSPIIKWEQFSQDAVSDKMWAYFKQVVQLCHAHQYWEEAARIASHSRPPPSDYGKETTYARKKRLDGWKHEIERAKGHMHRAAFLTAESIASMSYLLTEELKGTADWNLYWALRLAVRHQPNHERARCKVAAFVSFDSGNELRGEPPEIARRWLRQAGYQESEM